MISYLTGKSGAFVSAEGCKYQSVHLYPKMKVFFCYQMKFPGTLKLNLPLFVYGLFLSYELVKVYRLDMDHIVNSTYIVESIIRYVQHLPKIRNIVAFHRSIWKKKNCYLSSGDHNFLLTGSVYVYTFFKPSLSSASVFMKNDFNYRVLGCKWGSNFGEFSWFHRCMFEYLLPTQNLRSLRSSFDKSFGCGPWGGFFPFYDSSGWVAPLSLQVKKHWTIFSEKNISLSCVLTFVSLPWC